MAANYWASSQRRHWLFSREKLADIRDGLWEKDKVAHSQFPLPDQRLLNIYFNQRRSCGVYGWSLRLMNTRAHQAWKAHVH